VITAAAPSASGSFPAPRGSALPRKCGPVKRARRLSLDSPCGAGLFLAHCMQIFPEKLEYTASVKTDRVSADAQESTGKRSARQYALGAAVRRFVEPATSSAKRAESWLDRVLHRLGPSGYHLANPTSPR